MRSKIHAHCNILAHAKWHAHRPMTVPRLTTKGQKVGCGPTPRNPHPFLKYSEYPSHALAYEITHSYKNWQLHTLEPLAFLDCPLCEMCISLNKLFPLYYGLFLNSLPPEAKNPSLAAIPGAYLRLGTWPFSHALLSLLQHYHELQISLGAQPALVCPQSRFQNSLPVGSLCVWRACPSESRSLHPLNTPVSILPSALLSYGWSCAEAKFCKKKQVDEKLISLRKKWKFL